MRVAIVYVFPTVAAATYEGYAARFRDTYMTHPPGQSPHDLIAVINGPNPNTRQRRMFNPVPVQMWQHNNFGKDIGAFQMAAEKLDHDLMICLGSNIHFRQAGWLDRIVRAYEDYGPGLYGCWAFHQPTWHIRTTAFWLPPELLRSYPSMIGDGHRYEFEHGATGSILRFVMDRGFPCRMVTWRGCYGPEEWHHVENADCLMLDQHTDRIGYT